MEVEHRSQGVMVNALGFLYASLGFSLSVLGALLNAIYKGGTISPDMPPLPGNELRVRKNSKVRAGRSLHAQRSFSDQSSTAKKASTIVSEKRKPSGASASNRSSPAGREKRKSAEKESKEKGARSSSMHSHRRSRSMIPTITIDYFGSTESLRRNSIDSLKTDVRLASAVHVPQKPHILPTHASSPDIPIITTALPDLMDKHISPPNSTTTTSSFTSNSSNGERDREKHTFRLLNIKQWGKDKPKGGLSRTRSSPQLCHAPILPAALCHKQAGSDGGETLKNLPAKINPETPKPHKTLRKMSSAPGREKTASPKSAGTTPSRGTEKKRSQTLRTHPYEAPYFAPPPVPPLPRNIQSRPSSSKSLNQSPSKSQLAKP
ncbi:hypothetical protein CPC08DRAFT_521130 [Agrocybe pediades]|nr:hypothetical protein CPC08DRAFT_521130 [Agrocybe pediades]